MIDDLIQNLDDPTAIEVLTRLARLQTQRRERSGNAEAIGAEFEGVLANVDRERRPRGGPVAADDLEGEVARRALVVIAEQDPTAEADIRNLMLVAHRDTPRSFSSAEMVAAGVLAAVAITLRPTLKFVKTPTGFEFKIESDSARESLRLFDDALRQYLRLPPRTQEPAVNAHAEHPKIDSRYVVFAQINGIKERRTHEIAGAVGALMEVDAAVRKIDPEIRTYSSVYGRFWTVPSRVSRAVDCAEVVLAESAKRGVPVGVGVTFGEMEETADLIEANQAGTVINRAARLAFLEHNERRIALDDEVADDALDIGRLSDADVSPRTEGQVKRTKVVYRYLTRPEPELGKAHVIPVEGIKANVVVYDIEKFSEMTPRNMVRTIESLKSEVRRAMAAISAATLQRGRDYWYAPAGDGGVIVFDARHHRPAWTFAQALLRNAADIPIRIGLASGIVVAVGDHLPVGKAILHADHLSSLAEPGRPCVSPQFWNALDEREAAEFEAVPHKKDPEALVISPE